MGTPAYMSPEQARGKPVDHHTDIWSFGCIMYQMLTSQLPFDGETATDILVRILEREPDWELIPSETPENIRVLLHRCLEKDPHRRLKLIRDATIEIKETLNLMADGSATLVQSPRPKQLTDREGSCRIKSLAVLPLENLTGDPQQEYFADGMTEALIADLGKIGALQVRSRTSIMQYKSVKKLLPAIARELNVDAIVEGSVMRVAERVRITAQLIHAPTDTHIWVDSYERDLCDILNLLSEVARTIAHQIEIKVTPEQEVLLSAKRPINPEAYEAYQRGMFLLNKFTPEGIKKGLDYLNQAIEKDPGDPLAYGKLALGYAAIAHGPGAPPNALEQTEKAALKALELDKTLVEAHAALAHIKLYRDWDWEAAEKALQRALKLNPSLTLTHSHYSWYLLLFGRMDEAFMEMRRVQELDPLMPLWPAYLGTQYLWAGRYEESINEIQKSLELDSNLAYGLDALGSAYAAKGMFEEAIKAHLRACELGREWKSGLALTYAMAGRNDEARLVLDELEVDATTYDTWFIAQVYAVLGQNDEAFHWLEKACGPPKQPYVPWTKQCPAYRSLHDDPRYEDLLRRMNLLQ
jgi:TolB-like protein/tetratricopeptide (TPR) repeat protein